MKLLFFFGIVGLIHSVPLSFNINAGLTGKPFPITRGFLGSDKKTVDAISRPIENAQFSLSGNVGGSQANSVSHQIERSYSSSNLDSGLATSSQNSASYSLSKSASLGSNIDSSSHQIERSFSSGSQRSLKSGKRGSLLLSRSGSLGSNVISSSHQIESDFGAVSSNLGGQATSGANFIGQEEGANLALSRSGSLGTNVVSSSHQIESGFGALSSNLGGQASLESSLLSQAESASSLLSRSGSLDSTIDSSSHQIRNNLRSSSSSIGGIQEHFETGLAKTNSHHQASNFLKSASAFNVDSSSQHQIESSLSAGGVDSSVSEERVENYPTGYLKSYNFGSDSLKESGGARTYNEAVDLEELLRRQNSNAHYTFSSDIKDNINDLTQERAEVRDGLNVRGHYSYSDGNIRYIVHYVADENGYRIEKQETIKLEGPKLNPLGTAEIDAKNNDVEIHYGVRSIPINNGTLIIRK